MHTLFIVNSHANRRDCAQPSMVTITVYFCASDVPCANSAYVFPSDACQRSFTQASYETTCANGHLRYIARHLARFSKIYMTSGTAGTPILVLASVRRDKSRIAIKRDRVIPRRGQLPSRGCWTRSPDVSKALRFPHRSVSQRPPTHSRRALDPRTLRNCRVSKSA